MDEYSFNSASYGVKTRAEGKLLLLRILLILGYVLFSVGYCVVFLVPVKMPALIAILPIFLLVLIPSTWRLVSFDYEYVVEHGDFAVEKLYSTKKRRRILSVRLREAVRVVPLTADVSLAGLAVRDYRGTQKSPDSYLLEFRAEDGKPTAVLFEATTKLVKMIAKYNSVTVVSDGLSL
ncbi:MAG: hypothetical protein IKC73_00055 [Clostridia bacterium]|nr:hypothetical protein [Clostridia bacterium]